MLLALFTSAALSAEPEGFVIEAAVAFEDLDGGAVALRLSAGQKVSVRARSTGWYRSVSTPESGHRRYLVSTPEGEGWVDGAHLALVPDGGDPWPGTIPQPMALGPVRAWPALREAADWTDIVEDIPRLTMEGWLVVERPAGLSWLPLVFSNGWGSVIEVEQAVQRDLSGDGVDDLLLVLAESVTEAGSAGRTIRVLDLLHPEAPLLELPVHDPHWNGLATESRWGWVDVHLDEQRIVATRAELVPCGQDHCLERVEQRWSWGEKGIVAGPSHREPLQASFRGRRVCLGRVEGPIGIGDPFEVEVGPCGGRRQRKVLSTRLRFEEPLMAEVLGPWPEEQSAYVRFDWHR